jgi:hypothetical protein
VRLMPINAAASRWSMPSSRRRAPSALPMVASSGVTMSGAIGRPTVSQHDDSRSLSLAGMIFVYSPVSRYLHSPLSNMGARVGVRTQKLPGREH